MLVTACENNAQPPVADVDVAANLRNVSVAEAADLLQSDDKAIVLDVRSVKEFESGHIEGAMNVSFHQDDFETALSQLDKDASYVLTCESGGRSGKTLRKLKKLGFSSVAHMDAGMAGWRREGLPMATDR
jgi:rhodanese-related sulfurtransferase